MHQNEPSTSDGRTENSFQGMTGEISEIRRSDGVLFLEWIIPRFLSLQGEDYDFYISPCFAFYNGCWFMRMWPNIRPPGWVYLSLCREDTGTPKTVNVAVGLRESGGVVNRKEGEKEFKDQDSWWFSGILCLRSELRAQRHRLMSDDALVITCEMKVPSSAREQPSDVLVIYSYKDLQTATQNFSDLPVEDGGYRIGEGGFGTVYRAVVKGEVVAVKRLKDPMDTQFITELKTLTNYRHENLLPLLGCSLGPTCCLVYEFMQNGSLEDRLACKDQSEPLSWQTRLSIAYGSAQGINHLHTFGEEPLVHRDIKSANILLDQNLVPKVGDFGLVRPGSSGGSTTNPVTERLIGTRGYMPREALYGDVSVKWDTFSFGVVLLELLTGLPPHDANRKYMFLVTHMESCKDILPKLDSKAEWNREAAIELYRITQRCLIESKRSRPAISEILEDLKNCLSNPKKNTQRKLSFLGRIFEMI